MTKSEFQDLVARFSLGLHTRVEDGWVTYGCGLRIAYTDFMSDLRRWDPELAELWIQREKSERAITVYCKKRIAG
jgi:hypothetical protein